MHKIYRPLSNNTMLTIKEVSKILHVHPNTLRRWSDNGIIRSCRIGQRADRRFRRDDINRFLAQFQEEVRNYQKANMAGNSGK